jgi:hypothetical protein
MSAARGARARTVLRRAGRDLRYVTPLPGIPPFAHPSARATASRWRRFQLPSVIAGLAIVTGLCAGAVPLLHPGFPLGHDLPAHLTYVYLFDRALEGGQFPVRWTQGVRIGDGQPLFSFYQPGFYYLVQLVHLIVPSLGTSMKLAIAGLWGCGAAFMFRLKAVDGWIPAALGAVVFAGSPYLLLDINVRAAYPEFAAIMCAVGALWALGWLFESPGPGPAALLACLLAIALVCHLPATLIFGPVLIGRAMIAAASSPDRRRGLGWCAAAVLLALGLSAFYVVPALGERDLIQMGALTHGYFDYQKHFVEPAQWLRYGWGSGASVPGPADGMSFQVGVVQWGVIAAAIGCSVAAAWRKRLARDDWDLVFWLITIGFALFMTSAASMPVWAAAPQLSYLQFPWRFLMLVSVAGGCLAANLLGRLHASRHRALVLTAAVVLQLLASRDQRRPEHYLPRTAMDIDRPGWSDTPEAQKEAFVEPGYYPVGASGPVGTSDPRLADRRDSGGRRWTTSDAGSLVQPRVTADHRIELEVQTKGGTDLVLASRMGPGWTVRVGGREVPARIDPRRGSVRVRVPPGRYVVDVELHDTWLRRLANVVSAASAALIVVLVVFTLTSSAGPWGDTSEASSPRTRGRVAPLPGRHARPGRYPTPPPAPRPT